MRNYDHYLKAGVLSNCIAATNQVHYLKKDENVWQKRHMALIYLYCHHLDPCKMLFCDSFTMTKVVDAGSCIMPDSFHCHPYIEKVTGCICFKSDISIMPDRFIRNCHPYIEKLTGRICFKSDFSCQCCQECICSTMLTYPSSLFVGSSG